MAHRSTSARPGHSGTCGLSSLHKQQSSGIKPLLHWELPDVVIVFLAGGGLGFVYPFFGVGGFGPFAGDLFCGDVEAVPDVGNGDVEEEGSELGFVEVAFGFVPEDVWIRQMVQHIFGQDRIKPRVRECSARNTRMFQYNPAP